MLNFFKNNTLNLYRQELTGKTSRLYRITLLKEMIKNNLSMNADTESPIEEDWFEKLPSKNIFDAIQDCAILVTLILTSPQANSFQSVSEEYNRLIATYKKRETVAYIEYQKLERFLVKKLYKTKRFQVILNLILAGNKATLNYCFQFGPDEFKNFIDMQMDPLIKKLSAEQQANEFIITLAAFRLYYEFDYIKACQLIDQYCSKEVIANNPYLQCCKIIANLMELEAGQGVEGALASYKFNFQKLKELSKEGCLIATQFLAKRYEEGAILGSPDYQAIYINPERADFFRKLAILQGDFRFDQNHSFRTIANHSYPAPQNNFLIEYSDLIKELATNINEGDSEAFKEFLSNNSNQVVFTLLISPASMITSIQELGLLAQAISVLRQTINNLINKLLAHPHLSSIFALTKIMTTTEGSLYKLIFDTKKRNQVDQTDEGSDPPALKRMRYAV